MYHVKHSTLIITIALLALSASMAACSSQRTMLEDPTPLINYQKEPSVENLETLSKAYAATINRYRKEKVKYPGMYADYAVTLAKLGNQGEANRYFNMEIEAFPSSREYVNKLKSMVDPLFEPEQSATTQRGAQQVPVDTTLTEGMREAVKNVIDEAQARDTDATVVKAKKTNDDGASQVKKKTTKKQKGKKSKRGRRR